MNRLQRCRNLARRLHSAKRRYTPLFAEKLEDRALLAPLVEYQVHVLAPNDPVEEPNLTSVGVGQYFDLAVTVNDLRPTGQGVFIGYLDIAYDSSLARVQTSELQEITIRPLHSDTQELTSGTFSLRLGSQTTAPINFNSNAFVLATAIKNAISALSNVGNGNVQVTPFYNGNFEVKFVNALYNQDVPPLVVAASNLAGPSNPVVSISNNHIMDLTTEEGRAQAFKAAFRSNQSLYQILAGAEDLPNLINDVGASLPPFDGIIPGPGRFELVRARFKATAAGSVTFAADVAHLLRPMHDTVLYPGLTAAPQDIDVGIPKTLTIVSPTPIVTTVDSLVIAEDASATTIDVLANDTTQPANGTKEVVSVTQPANGSVTDTAAGIAYTPAPNFSGTDTFTYVARNISAGVASTTSTATVTVTVNPVNDAPSFTKGPNQSTTDGAGPQSITGWATAIAAGPPNEAAQTPSFVVTNDNNGLFTTQPEIDVNGRLIYTPTPNASGTATVTVQLKDNGGTAAGGSDTSAAQTFLIEVTRPFVWRNTAYPINVNASDESSPVSPIDAVLVINFLNSTGGGTAVPQEAPIGPPYLDVNGDNFVSAIDAVLVINYLNAHPNGAPPAGEGESAALSSAASSDHQGIDELLMLMALDADDAYLARRRRM